MSNQPHGIPKKPRKLIAATQLKHWSAGLAEIVRHPDATWSSREFGSSLAKLIPSDQWWMIFYRDNEIPILFDYYDADSRRDTYAQGPYLLCPFYNAFLNGVEPGCYRLQDLAARNPSKFARFTKYYHEPIGPLDEIGLIFPTDKRTTALVTLARARSKWKFTTSDIEALEAVFPIAQAVTERICSNAQLFEESRSKDRVNNHNRLLSIFNNYGMDVLTERELEVNRLLIRGFSAKEIARILNITEGTSRNHMKQVYAKLEVSSQIELCGILIERLLQSYSSEN